MSQTSECQHEQKMNQCHETIMIAILRGISFGDLGFTYWIKFDFVDGILWSFMCSILWIVFWKFIIWMSQFSKIINNPIELVAFLKYFKDFVYGNPRRTLLESGLKFIFLLLNTQIWILLIILNFPEKSLLLNNLSRVGIEPFYDYGSHARTTELSEATQKLSRLPT